MQIDNRTFYQKLRKLAAPISFQSLMLAAVAALPAALAKPSAFQLIPPRTEQLQSESVVAKMTKNLFICIMV